MTAKMLIASAVLGGLMVLNPVYAHDTYHTRDHRIGLASAVNHVERAHIKAHERRIDRRQERLERRRAFVQAQARKARARQQQRQHDYDHNDDRRGINVGVQLPFVGAGASVNRNGVHAGANVGRLNVGAGVGVR